MSQPMSGPRVSVVVPARDAADTLPDCLRALRSQSLPANTYEILVVVDMRSTDATHAVAGAQPGVRVIELAPPAGARRFTAGSRNAGIDAAAGEWIAFTDADCVPSRRWLKELLALADAPGDGSVLGVAGQTVGLDSHSAAARYVDVSGGLRAEKHLAHPRYPWPPALNVMYRRAALLAVGGFDDRFSSYEVADLHARLLREVGGAMPVADRAVVHHRHRRGWRDYWRQQRSYGEGYAQFFHRYSDELGWRPLDELRAWLALVPIALGALVPGRSDAALRRRGNFVKRAAQRLGFATTYWSPSEAQRWREAAPSEPAEA
jgi:cellulose synthase/poly-beta-1,6-N-acetylglucosamine synthase-like glycosyltransferase